MNNSVVYEAYLKERLENHEAACKHCGACCGRFEKDPCANLRRVSGEEYICGNYENRLGMQKTVAGNEFKCVPVRNILFKSWSGSWQCAYKKQIVNCKNYSNVDVL